MMSLSSFEISPPTTISCWSGCSTPVKHCRLGLVMWLTTAHWLVDGWYTWTSVVTNLVVELLPPIASRLPWKLTHDEYVTGKSAILFQTGAALESIFDEISSDFWSNSLFFEWWLPLHSSIFRSSCARVWTIFVQFVLDFKRSLRLHE